MKSFLKILCLLLVFFSIAQPAILLPRSEPYRLFFILALLTSVLYLMNKEEGLAKLPQNKFIMGLLITYTLSRVQFLWGQGIIEIFIYWAKKIVVYFLVINIFTDVKILKKAFWAVTCATIIQSWLGWNLYIHHSELLHNVGRLEALGNYNLGNSFALLLTLCFPLTFSLMELEKNFLKKLILISAQILLVISCIFTKSRGGNIGIMIGISLCILSNRYILKKKLVKTISIGLLLMFFFGYTVNIIDTRSDVASITGGDSSSENREIAWKVAFRMFLSNPVFGIGYGKYHELDNEYTHDINLPNCHNTFLSVLAETGIFGFIFYVSALWLTIKQLIQIRKLWSRDENKIPLSVLSKGILISLICFMFNSSFSVKDHEPIFWILLSLAGSLSFIYQKDLRNQSTNEIVSTV